MIWNHTQHCFTVLSPIPSTHLGIWACGSTWRRHTGKHSSSAPHQRITQPTSWPHVASPTRPPGRSWNKWLDQIRNDSTRPIGDLWRRAVDRGHGGATTRRPSPATRPWWCWWWWWYNKPLFRENWNKWVSGESDTDPGHVTQRLRQPRHVVVRTTTCSCCRRSTTCRRCRCRYFCCSCCLDTAERTAPCPRPSPRRCDKRSPGGRRGHRGGREASRQMAPCRRGGRSRDAVTSRTGRWRHSATLWRTRGPRWSLNTRTRTQPTDGRSFG